MRAASRGAVTMAMLFIVTIWEFLRTIPGTLEKIQKGLLESVFDIFSDPEGIFPFIIFLIVLWALIALAKLCVGVVDELVARKSGTGSNRLGLN